jgi:hypothetical protein
MRDVAGVKAIVDGTDPILVAAVLTSVAIGLGLLATPLSGGAGRGTPRLATPGHDIVN